MKQGDLSKYVDMLRQAGADVVKLIDTSSVSTAPWVVFKCQYGCPNYGTNLCCPPHTPAYEETRRILDSYSKALLFTYHSNKRASKTSEEVCRQIFFDGYYKVISFGNNGCDMCEECNMEKGCRYPDKARPSLGGCGIDVFETAKRNNIEIKTLKDKNETRTSFGLILIE